MRYTEKELSCLRKIHDPLWLALYDIRPPYKSYENYTKFLSESLRGRASLQLYNQMIHYSVFAHKLALAERLFDDMLQKGVKPSADTFNSMIHGYMQECHVDKAITYFSQMMKLGAPPNLQTYAEMIHGLMDNSRFEQAHSMLPPAQLQYELSDELSFSALQQAFSEDHTLDIRAWLSQFLPSSSLTPVTYELEHIGSKGAKLEGKFQTTHPAELNIIFSFKGEDKRTSVKFHYKKHVARVISKKKCGVIE